jgi:hypothetical protein
LDELKLGLFTDADYAGDKSDYKSTSGMLLAIYGKHSFFPLVGQSKKQTSCSSCTSEAEIVAMYKGLVLTGIPALDLWDVIFQRKTVLDVFQDNQSTQNIVHSGKAPTLRHVDRTQGVSIRSLHDWSQNEWMNVQDCHSSEMAADIFTKSSIRGADWVHACELIGIRSHSIVKSLAESRANDRVPACVCLFSFSLSSHPRRHLGQAGLQEPVLPSLSQPRAHGQEASEADDTKRKRCSDTATPEPGPTARSHGRLWGRGQGGKRIEKGERC